MCASLEIANMRSYYANYLQLGIFSCVIYLNNWLRVLCIHIMALPFTNDECLGVSLNVSEPCSV